MARDKYGNIVIDEEEEEKKPVLPQVWGASIAHQEMTRAKTSTVPRAAQQEVVGRQKMDASTTTPEAIRQFSNDYLSRPQEDSPIVAYFKMAKELGGKHEANARLKEAVSIWRRYLKPFGGAETVLALARSPYTYDELEQLGQRGQRVLFNFLGTTGDNYLPAKAASLNKDGQFVQAVVGMGLGVTGGYRSQYELNPRGYMGVNPMNVAMTREQEERYKTSAEYQQSIAWLEKHEKWGDEFQLANEDLIKAVEDASGVKRSSVTTWQQWEGMVQDARDDVEWADLERFDRAFDDFAQARSKWLAANHQEDLNARALATTAQMGLAAGRAGLLYTTGAGLLSWGSLGLFSKFMTGLGATMITGEAAASVANPEEAAFKLSEGKLKEYQENVFISEGAKQAFDLKAMVIQADSAGDREAIKNIVRELQKRVVGPDGMPIREGMGRELPLDGRLTSEVMSYIDEAADIMVGAAVQLQQELLASGYAPAHLKITGSFDKKDTETGEWAPDPEWTKALELAQKDWAAQLKMAEDHPYLYSFLTTSGMPLSMAGLRALGNRLVSEGKPNAPLKAIAQVGLYIGGTVNAVPGLLEVNRRFSKDSYLNDIRTELVELVSENLPPDDDDIPFEVMPDSINAAKAQWLVESGYIDIPRAEELVNRISAREIEIVSEPTHAWAGAIAYSTKEAEEARAWLADNIDAVHAFNMLIDIVGQIVLMRGARVASSTVGRTAQAFNASGKMARDLGKIVKYANEGDMGAVSEIVGGSEARAYVQELAHYRYGRDIYKPEAEMVQTKATEIAELAREGDVDGIVKSMSSRAEPASARDWATRVVRLAESYKEAQTAKVVKAEGKLAERKVAAQEKAAETYDASTQKRIDRLWKNERQAQEKLATQRKEATDKLRRDLETRHSKDKPGKTYPDPEYPGFRMEKQQYIQLKVERAMKKRFDARPQRIRSSYEDKVRNLKEAREAGRAEYLSTRATRWEESNVLRVRPAARSLEDMIAARLTYRQWGKGDVFGVRPVNEFAPNLARDMWSGNRPDGHYYDIFPQRNVNVALVHKNQSRAALELAISKIQNPRARALASGVLLPFYRQPLKSYSTQLADFPGRVADYVATVTNDLALVAKWRTKAALVDFNLPRAVESFTNELVTLRGEYMADVSLRGRPARVRKLPEGVEARDQLTGLKIAGAKEGEPLYVGHYKANVGGKTVEREVVMQTSQLAHEVPLGRDVMWAKLQGRTEGNWIYQAYLTARNSSRAVEGVLNRFSSPLRIMSVGSGAPILFGKHCLNDTARTIVQEGPRALRLAKNRQGFESRIAQADLRSADFALFNRKVSIDGELHYNLEGGYQVTRAPLRAYDARGRPKHMNAAVDTVRRLIMGEGFRQFAQGGHQQLIKWLRSEEGYAFLERSGAVSESRLYLKQEGRPALSEGDFKEFVVNRYLDRNLELFENYAELPRLNQSMLDMAAGRTPHNSSAIKQAIVEAYRHGENPIADVPLETGNVVVDIFSKATKAAMTPNRLNRQAVHDRVFNDVFDRLTKKDHVPPSDAVRIASTVAQARVGKVHFDLSNAMRFEMRHRWFAWFGTKHRLWNTWLATTAAAYPGYAAAIHEFLTWMEDRNKDTTAMPWEKHNIRFKIGERQVSINMAPWTWLMDYAIESALGHAVGEVGAYTVNKVLGTDIRPSPQHFKPSLTRLDEGIRTIYRVLQAPLREGTQDDWVEYISNLPEDERNTFNKQVFTLWAMQGGEEGELTLKDCCAKVVLGNVRHEAARFFKPSSTRIYTEDETEFAEMAYEFEKLSGDYAARREYLNLNPWFAATLGVGKRDPFEQAELTQFQSLYFQYRNDYSSEITRAWYTGKIEDGTYMSNLFNQLEVGIERLKSESRVFKEWMDTTGEGRRSFEESAHMLFPIIPAEEWEKSRVPTQAQREIHEVQDLRPAFERACIAYGITTNSTGLLAQMLRDKYINEPMAIFMKSLPGDLSYAARKNAQLLARTPDAGGVFRATTYIETVLSTEARKFWLSGLKEGKGDPNNLVMPRYTTAEKEHYGWRSDDEVWSMWLEYAVRLQQIEEYTGTLDKSTSGKLAIELKAALRQEVEENWMQRNETFAKEWNFSHMRTYERMRLMGYGEGKSEAARGWDECLLITENYWAELDSTVYKKQVGVSPQAEIAGPINKKYLQMLVDLMNENKEWFAQFQRIGMTASKLGFRKHWRLPSRADLPLWGPESSDEEDFIDYIEG